jgi:PIN domain nuclease of toxin-antitoxin system
MDSVYGGASEARCAICSTRTRSLGQWATPSALLENASNDILTSPTSIREMSAEFQLGRWPEVAPFMDDAVRGSLYRRLGAKELGIVGAHARLAGSFDVPHEDPCDRMLVAQAVLEGIAILSTALDAFPITRLR